MRRLIWYPIIFICVFIFVNEYKLRRAFEVDSPALIRQSDAISQPEALKDSAAQDEVPVEQVDPCINAGYVFNTTFSDEIKNRLPHTLVNDITDELDELYLFFEVIGSTVPQLAVQWSRNGKLMPVQEHKIKGIRWRIWSRVDFALKAGDQISVEVAAGDCPLYHHALVVKPASEDMQPVFLDAQKNNFGVAGDQILDMFYQNIYRGLQEGPAPVYRLLPSGSVAEDPSATRTLSTRDLYTQLIENNDPVPRTPYASKAIDRRTLLGDPVLIEAIKYGSLSTAASALEDGADPLLRDGEGKSALDLAVQSGNDELIGLLLEYAFEARAGGLSMSNWVRLYRETETRARNRLGETLLMRAAASGNEGAIIAITALMREASDVPGPASLSPYYLDYAGRTALDIALEGGYSGAAYLLERALRDNLPPWMIQRSVLASKVEGDIPVNCSIQNTDEIILVVDVLDMYGKDVIIKWSRGTAPVKVVKEEKFRLYQLQQRLISRLDTRDFEEGERFKAELWFEGRQVPLPGTNKVFTRSVTNHPFKCEDQFVIDGRFLSENFIGWVPIEKLQERIHADLNKIMHLIWRSDIYSDIQVSESHTGLEFLISAGADINFTQSNTSLMRRSVMNDRLSLVSFLIAKGFDIHKISDIERQPRSLINDAVSHASTAMIKLLHGYGVSIDEMSDNGFTPLARALSSCSEEKVALLLDLGADPDFRMPTHRDRPEQTVRAYGGERCLHSAEIRKRLQL